MRISHITAVGDARRQASTRLIVDGLNSEIDEEPRRALSRYEHAIRIDPGNPFAYLALARHYVSIEDPTRALEHLDRTRALFDAEGSVPPRVTPHVIGLRGAALTQLGRDIEAEPLLNRARVLAPSVWADGHLSAREFR